MKKIKNKIIEEISEEEDELEDTEEGYYILDR